MGNGPSGKRHNTSEDDLEVSRGVSTSSSTPTIPPKKKLIVRPTDDVLEVDAITRILNDANVDDMSARLRATNLTDAISGTRGSTLPTVFKWEGGGKDVYISGTFNGWKAKIPMVKSKHNFYTIVDLPEGEHQYKFIVDGQWKVDTNQRVVTNNYGTQNNVIEVKPTDFDVLEALLQDMSHSRGAPDMRSASEGGIPMTRTGNSSADDNEVYGGGSPPGDYSQRVPQKPFLTEIGSEKMPTPPLLPPHLLQVILNKDTGSHCDPNLLPQPNHVMVNHMYALSIKDGVIVLSAITRYRQKFVSTVIYKPI